MILGVPLLCIIINQCNYNGTYNYATDEKKWALEKILASSKSLNIPAMPSFS